MAHLESDEQSSTAYGTGSHDLVARITAVIAQKLRVGPEHLQPEYTLDELGLDSLTSAEVVLGVEKDLGVRIDFEAEAESFSRDTTLEDFIALVARMAEQAPCAG